MPTIQSPPGPETVIDGRRYLYFGGTGYLGLQGHPEVIRAACRAARQYGIGSATSRAGFGSTPPVLEVERQARRFFAMDEAFYFPSGYMGNHILVLLLEGCFEAVFVDERSHYSVLEAARLTGRPVFAFRHVDVADLEAQLRGKLAPRARPLVMTDGVFAARGDLAPLAGYRSVLRAYRGSILLVDDAHGVGVLGPSGRGTLDHFGLLDGTVNAGGAAAGEPASPPVVLFCTTLSKAIGGYGGVIPGTGRFLDWAKARSTYYAGASPPPAPVAAASARALALAADPTRRLQLHCNVDRARQGLKRLGLPLDRSPVPIICLTLGDVANMRRIEQDLRRRGIVVPYLPQYAGLPPEGALRLALFATHTQRMIDRLIEALGQLL